MRGLIAVVAFLLFAEGSYASAYEAFFASAEKHQRAGNLEAAVTDYGKAAATTNDPFLAAPALAMQCIVLGQMQAWERAARLCDVAADRIPVSDGRTAGMSALSMYNAQWALYALGKYEMAIAASKQMYAAHVKSADLRAYDLVSISLFNRAWSFVKLKNCRMRWTP